MYKRQLYDGLFDLLGAETFQKLVEKQAIEVAPLAYMRGRTPVSYTHLDVYKRQTLLRDKPV